MPYMGYVHGGMPHASSEFLPAAKGQGNEGCSQKTRLLTNLGKAAWKVFAH